MAISINHRDAEKKLLAAFRARCTKNDDLSNRIEAILNGNHKTYKYVLLKGNYTVIAHKVNQSGASSKEIGDIDIFKFDTDYYPISIPRQSL